MAGETYNIDSRGLDHETYNVNKFGPDYIGGKTQVGPRYWACSFQLTRVYIEKSVGFSSFTNWVGNKRRKYACGKQHNSLSTRLVSIDLKKACQVNPFSL